MLNFAANTTAILSLASTALEAGQMGIRDAKATGKRALAIKDIKDATGDGVLNKSSEKHNAMKAMLREANFTSGLCKAKGTISGFAKGVGKGMKGNIPSVVFATATLISKRPSIKLACTVLTGLSTGWDFIKNGTNLFADRDIIEK